jgi:hypothetical protein
LNNKDLTCKATHDAATGVSTYELRVSRKYLSDNSSPDNLLSYTLDFGNAAHNFRLTEEAQKALAELGVESEYLWTYNYAYFGSRPETTPEPVETESETETETEPVTETETEPVTETETETETTTATETEPDTSEQVTEPAPSKTGCKSSVSVSIVAVMLLLGGCVTLCKKKR